MVLSVSSTSWVSCFIWSTASLLWRTEYLKVQILPWCPCSFTYPLCCNQQHWSVGSVSGMRGINWKQRNHPGWNQVSNSYLWPNCHTVFQTLMGLSRRQHSSVLLKMVHLLFGPVFQPKPKVESAVINKTNKNFNLVLSLSCWDDSNWLLFFFLNRFLSVALPRTPLHKFVKNTVITHLASFYQQCSRQTLLWKTCSDRLASRFLCGEKKIITNISLLLIWSWHQWRTFKVS